MPRSPRKSDKGEHPAFPRVAEKAPPSWFSRLLGASDAAGAEVAINNFLSDLGPEEITPRLVSAVCAQYGVAEAKRDQIIHSILRAAAERQIKRDVLTEEGKQLMPRLAISLGIPEEEVTKAVTSGVMPKSLLLCGPWQGWILPRPSR